MSLLLATVDHWKYRRFAKEASKPPTATLMGLLNRIGKIAFAPLRFILKTIDSSPGGGGANTPAS